MLPERFDLTYIDEHGQPQRPIAIHRAIYGSLERFIGILVEHFAGAFPLWLAPVQAVVIPIADRHIEAGQRARRRAARARPAGRGRRLVQPDAEQDPARPGAEGAVHGRPRRPRDRGPDGVAADAGAASSSRPEAVGGVRRPARRGGRAARGASAQRRGRGLATVADRRPTTALCYRPAFGSAPRALSSARAGRQRIDVATKGSTISRDLRVNQMIRIPQVRVVDEEGAQLGVMPTPQALEMAQERGFDLVEVAPMAAPPVVKFLDFGQYKYELTKREKEAKRQQRSVTFKEVRLSPKIGVGDFDTKVHRAIEFLEDGDRIKVTVRFRGRELTHPELGRNLLARFVERIKDHGVAERTPLLEGKSMHITVASIHKPKSHEAPARTEAPPNGRRRAPSRQRTGRDGPADRRRDPADARPAPATRPPAAAAPAGRHRRPRRSEPRREPQPAPPPRRTRAARSRAAAAQEDRPQRTPAPRAGAEQESEASVPKIKSHKAAQKRIGVTGSGKYRPGQRLARPPPRDQVVPTHPPLCRQVAHRARARQAGPSPAAVPLGAAITHGTSQAGRHRPQAPQAPSQRRRGPQGHQVAPGQAGARGAPPRAGLRDPRPQAAQAPDARAVDRPDQRRGPPATA